MMGLAMGWMAAAAAAADVTYTFNVPVEAQQLPTALIDKLAVVCGVYVNAEELASGTVDVLLDAGGNVQATVAVPVTLAESAAMRARRWRCQPQFSERGRIFIPQGPAFQVVPGSSSRWEVMGDLP